MKELCPSPDLVFAEEYHTTRKTLWNHSESKFAKLLYHGVLQSFKMSESRTQLSFYGYILILMPSAKSVWAPSIFHLHVSCLYRSQESFMMAGWWQWLVAVLGCFFGSVEMLKCLQAGFGLFKCFSDSVLRETSGPWFSMSYHDQNHFCGLWLEIRSGTWR